MPLLNLPHEGSPENIPQSLLPTIPIIIEEYKKFWNLDEELLVSIYIYGSVANGSANNMSDIDTIGFVHVPKGGFTKNHILWVEYTKRHVYYTYKEFPEIDFKYYSFESLLDNKHPLFSMLLATNSICIYGKDIRSKLKLPTTVYEATTILFDFLEKEISSIKSISISPYNTKSMIKYSREWAKYLIRFTQFYSLIKAGTYSSIYTKQLDLMKQIEPADIPAFEWLYNIRQTGTTDIATFRKLKDSILKEFENVKRIVRADQKVVFAKTIASSETPEFDSNGSTMP